MEHQTIGQWDARPIDPATQRIILKIVGFQVSVQFLLSLWISSSLHTRPITYLAVQTDIYLQNKQNCYWQSLLYVDQLVILLGPWLVFDCWIRKQEVLYHQLIKTYQQYDQNQSKNFVKKIFVTLTWSNTTFSNLS